MTKLIVQPAEPGMYYVQIDKDTPLIKVTKEYYDHLDRERERLHAINKVIAASTKKWLEEIVKKYKKEG